MQIIDAHNHFWQYDPREYAWMSAEMSILRKDYLPEQLKAQMDRHGVQATVAVQARQSLEENHFLLDLADKFPFIKGVVGWLDLQKEAVAEELRIFSAHPKFKGIRHMIQSEEDDRFMLQPDFMRGIALLKDFDLTYDILIAEKQLPVSIKFVEAFPDQKLVLDHLAKPSIRSGSLEPWSGHIRTLAQNKNLYCKLSGLVTEAKHRHWKEAEMKPYLDVVFEAFGPERLMFGSDWPVCLLAADYSRVLRLIQEYIGQLSSLEQEMVMGLNARNFYKL
jgi:L-fuconolactonase